MKLTAFFAHVALAAVLTFLAGLAFNIAALPLFAIAACALVVAIGATDYSRRPNYDRSSASQVGALARRSEMIPLAA